MPPRANSRASAANQTPAAASRTASTLVAKQRRNMSRKKVYDRLTAPMTRMTTLLIANFALPKTAPAAKPSYGELRQAHLCQAVLAALSTSDVARPAVLPGRTPREKFRGAFDRLAAYLVAQHGDGDTSNLRRAGWGEAKHRAVLIKSWQVLRARCVDGEVGAAGDATDDEEPGGGAEAACEEDAASRETGAWTRDGEEMVSEGGGGMMFVTPSPEDHVKLVERDVLSTNLEGKMDSADAVIRGTKPVEVYFTPTKNIKGKSKKKTAGEVVVDATKDINNSIAGVEQNTMGASGSESHARPAEHDIMDAHISGDPVEQHVTAAGSESDIDENAVTTGTEEPEAEGVPQSPAAFMARIMAQYVYPHLTRFGHLD